MIGAGTGIDGDSDGIVDIIDQCPDVRETYNQYQDEDGCPDFVPGEYSTIRDANDTYFKINYSTIKSPTMPCKAWPGTVQM